MLLDAVRQWFGPRTSTVRPDPARSADQPENALVVTASEPPPTAWTTARLGLSERLWGEGFLFPGGAEETLRLVAPLGLNGELNLLLVGAGAGGPPRVIGAQFGAWVAGFEADPGLAGLAAERCNGARLGGRAKVEMWNPQAPSLRAQAYHHGLALEPLRNAQFSAVLSAITSALRPGGQLVMVDLVADEALDHAEPTVAAWRQAERRSADLPTERGVTRMLGRLGFEVRLAEDITDRHVRLATAGWSSFLRGLDERPSASAAPVLVSEAELWALRLRLIRGGRLRMVRWQAYAPRRPGQ